MTYHFFDEKADQIRYEVRLQCAACNSAYEWAMSFDPGTDQRIEAYAKYNCEVQKLNDLKSRLKIKLVGRP